VGRQESFIEKVFLCVSAAGNATCSGYESFRLTCLTLHLRMCIVSLQGENVVAATQALDAEAAFRNAHRISPSQIETYRLCPRKWAFDKLDGIPRVPNKYAARGTAVHAVLEEWQRDGKAVDLSTEAGKIASAGLKFLPQPGTHATEYSFIFDTGRAVYHGIMDLRGKPTFPIQSIWDHKTTTSFNWMKTPEILRKDPQANIYAMAVLQECAKHGLEIGKGFDRIEQNWVYYLADASKPRSRKVQLHVIRDEHARMPVRPPEVEKEHFGVMTLAELDERFEEIEVTAQEILTLYRQKPRALDVQYNSLACSAFGGCPYAGSACVLSLKERIENMEAKSEVKSLSLAEKIRAKLSGTPPPAAEPPTDSATNVTAPAAAPIPPPASSAAATAPAGPPPPPRKLASVPKANTAAAPATAPAARVNPPEEPREGQSTPTAATGDVRTEIAARAMQGLVASRVFSLDDNRYSVKISAEAVKLADALLAALAK